MSNSLYTINLKNLKDGEHTYSFFGEKGFFKKIESNLVRGGEFDADIVLVKRGNLYQLSILIEAHVIVDCDRCLAPLTVGVNSARNLIVKFGKEYFEESDEVLIIPEREDSLDLHWLIYEEIVVSLPMQRIHNENECDSDMMQYYQTHSMEHTSLKIDGTGGDENGVDLRWSALKALKKSLKSNN